MLERQTTAPPPRTAGCAFSPSGLLACFFNSPSPYAGLADTEAPRTFDADPPAHSALPRRAPSLGALLIWWHRVWWHRFEDFQSLVQGWELAPIVQLQRAMGGGGLDAAPFDSFHSSSVLGRHARTLTQPSPSA